MDDLIQDFIAETREMLEALGGEVVAWEAAPHDRDRLDAIFRFVHTVKGNCGFFDLPRLKSLSHAAEDALAEVRSGTRTPDQRLVSAVLGIIDRIGELVQAIESGTALDSEDDAPLIAALREQPTPEETTNAPAAATATRGAMRSIRLPIDLLDRMMNGVSDLVLARNELARGVREGAPMAEMDAAFDRLSATIAEVRDSVTRTRMQRIENLFAPLPRMVRDLANETGKQVALEIDGGDVELDREMIELIRDPLTHIIRNAIDHGIESAELRKRTGKPGAGALRVSARQAGNQILIEISDDGRGIDGEALVGKALAGGLIDSDQAARLTPAQRIELIFAAGLSTAKQVTAISGRGVGMDVVRANIERIGGIVEVDSRLGHGVRFTLKVPLTLTIIPALTVSAGGQTFAIPRSSVEEIVRPRGEGIRIETLGGASVVTLRGRRLPLVTLASILGFDAARSHEGILTLLKVAGGGVYALEVDKVQDHEELVIKPAAPALMATGLYAGTTLADDGRPVLLLDPAGMASRAGISLDRMESDERSDEIGGSNAFQALLLQTLGGARRAVALSAVERIEEVPAGAVQRKAGRLNVLVGERILPLEGCDTTIPEGKIKVLRLSDGETQVGYGFAEVIDTVTIAAEVIPSTGPGEVAGVVLVDGEQIEMIDLHWLFARNAASARPAERPVCVIPADDPWMDTILRPIVESAGYRVVAAGDADAAGAEVAIVGSGSEAPAAQGAARVLRLRSAPEPAGKGDDSIHRYDRAALIGALARGGVSRKKG